MNDSTDGRRQLLGLLATLGITAIDSAFAQAQPAASTDGGAVVFDDEHARVVERTARSGAGVCGSGMHSHPPHLQVYMTDAKVRVTLPDRTPFIEQRKFGGVIWYEGGPHAVENIGSADARVFLVERKKA